MHRDRRTNVIQRRAMVRGVEYGDVDALRKEASRNKAGTAADSGGLAARNTVPDGYGPATPHRTPDAARFPLIVWEGVLTDGIDAVLGGDYTLELRVERIE